jgi:DNA-binding XRE family transcriptional regulator
MMHYAPSERKCLLHQFLDYPTRMGTANDRLRQIRAVKYATAELAAKAIGVPTSTYIQHENGNRGSGSIPRAAAERYSSFFRVSLDWLLTGKGDEPDLPDDPSEQDLEAMLRHAIEDVVTVQTRISDLPRIVAPALHEQLERFRVDRGATDLSVERSARGTRAQSPASTRQAGRARSRTP